jgi:origin recognition complex subunit 5
MRIDNLKATDLNQKLDEESSMEPAKENQNSIRAFAQTLELPYYAKFLLIASFLASHNEAKSDKRLFMKHHGKQRKRQQKAKVRKNKKQKIKTQNHLTCFAF